MIVWCFTMRKSVIVRILFLKAPLIHAISGAFFYLNINDNSKLADMVWGVTPSANKCLIKIHLAHLLRLLMPQANRLSSWLPERNVIFASELLLH